MRVLMFGWEFPPHITGGLGTACYGLTKGLLKQDVEVIFIVPKAYGDEDQSAVRLVNASDVAVDPEDSEYKELWKRIKYMEVASNIIPYVSPEEFEEMQAQIEEELRKHREEHHVLGRKYEFSGKYGPRLMEEVSRYALIASAIAAKEDFDVILDLHNNLRSNILRLFILKTKWKKYKSGHISRYLRFKFNKIFKRIFKPLRMVERINTGVKRIFKDAPFSEPKLYFNDIVNQKFITLAENIKKPILGLIPGAFHSIKKWPSEYFNRISKIAIENGFSIFIFVSKEDEILAKEITENLPEHKYKVFINLDFETLKIALFHCDKVLSNDTGLAHLSSATGKKVCVIYGPTHPDFGFAPIYPSDFIRINIDCSPCTRHGTNKCKMRHFKCMKDLTPEIVWNKIRNL